MGCDCRLGVVARLGGKAAALLAFAGACGPSGEGTGDAAGASSAESATSGGAGSVGAATTTDGGAGATAGRRPNSGDYAEWYKGTMPSLPYLVGGQIVLEWSQIDKATGYDWSALDAALSATKLPTTLQINGSTKPSYVYARVPYADLAPCTTWPPDAEVADKDPLNGCPRVAMYWHPTFQSLYTSFIAALGQHLHASANGSKVIGIRQNWNAFGTEHIQVPSAFQSASAWTTPPGVAAGTDWSASARLGYEQAVIDAHVKAFFVNGKAAPPVLIRTNLDPQIRTTYETLFDSGKLGWFHTGSEMEPRTGGGGDYDVFLTYAASGKTVALAEPWANAWGIHSGIDDHHWASPPQFNYWRLLSDLQLGISYVDCYGDDLAVAQQGVYGGSAVPDYQAEFDAAFRFASKYAGYAGRPGAAPGAFIAFRPVDPAISNYSVADYAEFVSLLNASSTSGLDARTAAPGLAIAPPYGVTGDTYHSIGPTTQRFGAWARRLAQGAAAELQLDAAFETHENAQHTKIVNVTYLDDVAGHSFAIDAAGRTFDVALAGTGRWVTATFQTSGSFSRNSAGADVVVTARNGSVTLHMVEVTY